MGYTVEREVVTEVKTIRTEINKLEDWKTIQFESSTGKTPEFMAFSRMYRSYLGKEAKKVGVELVSWSTGHFECSAFFKNPQTTKYAYLSCSDVRFFPESWHSAMLVRTAQDDKDYTGGQNQSASLSTVGESLRKLTQ